MRLLALWLLAAPASAQGYGNGPSPGYVVPRNQPAARPAGDVQVLAEQLTRATSQVYLRAENELSRESYYRGEDDQREVLRALRRLDRLAQRFADSAAAGGASPAAREDFDRLMRAYGQAANLVEELRDFPGVYRAFYPVQQLMDRLAPYYGGYDRLGYHHDQGFRMRGPGMELGRSN